MYGLGGSLLDLVLDLELHAEQKWARKQARKKAWREANPERVKQYSRDQYARRRSDPEWRESAKEKTAAWHRRRYREDPAYRERKRQYKQRNLARRRELERARRANDPERVLRDEERWRESEWRYQLALEESWRKQDAREARAREAAERRKERDKDKWHLRQAKIRGAPRVESVNRLRVWELHAGRCCYCRRPVPADDFHLAHLVALDAGGEHTYANTAPAHPDCNLRDGVGRLSVQMHIPLVAA